MKILHTADWHLGKRLEGYPRMAEQKEVLDEICQIAEKEAVDVILIAGDIYDAFNPPNEAEEYFYKTVVRLSRKGERAVVAIAGNHDSPQKIEVPESLAHELGFIFAGFPDKVIKPFKLDTGLEVLRSEAGFIELKLPNHETPLRILLTPYANEFRLKKFLGKENEEEVLRNLLAERWKSLADKYCDKKGINLLLAHLFFMHKGEKQQEEPDDERPILIGGAQPIYTQNIPEQIQYTALGHLHRYQVLSTDPSPVVYSSSPLAYSFAETNQTKYVSIIELEAGEEAVHKKVPLSSGKKLVQETFDDVDQALQWLHDNPEVYVDLSIKKDTYITGEDLRRLRKAHSYIIGPNLIFTDSEGKIKDGTKTINLQEDVRVLFKDYFKNKHGMEANESILGLLEEVLGSEKESETK